MKTAARVVRHFLLENAMKDEAEESESTKNTTCSQCNCARETTSSDSSTSESRTVACGDQGVKGVPAFMLPKDDYFQYPGAPGGPPPRIQPPGMAPPCVCPHQAPKPPPAHQRTHPARSHHTPRHHHKSVHQHRSASVPRPTKPKPMIALPQPFPREAPPLFPPAPGPIIAPNPAPRSVYAPGPMAPPQQQFPKPARIQPSPQPRPPQFNQRPADFKPVCPPP
ncbi:hypothetical protein COOONC_18773, partial [Cooperia oncophora]